VPNGLSCGGESETAELPIGKKLFGSTSRPVNMKLVRNDISSTGVIIATYEYKG
jgi:hypothetical protein